jgi:hypothetical protein
MKINHITILFFVLTLLQACALQDSHGKCKDYKPECYFGERVCHEVPGGCVQCDCVTKDDIFTKKKILMIPGLNRLVLLILAKEHASLDTGNV